MSHRYFSRARAFVLCALAISCVVRVSTPVCFAQMAGKKVVKTEADLPRFNYALSGTATELLQSDDAAFGVFSAKVQADVDSVLQNYDIEDHAAMRQLLGVRLDLQLLAGNNQGATDTIARLRDLEDKPDARLMTGLQARGDDGSPKGHGTDLRHGVRAGLSASV